MPSILDEELSKEGVDTLSSRPFRNAGRQSGRQLSLCGTPEKSSYRQMSMSDRSSIRVEEIIPAARVAIQVRVLVVNTLRICAQVGNESQQNWSNVLSCVSTVALAIDDGGGGLYFHSGLLHASHLGCSCWPIGPRGQQPVNQREHQFHAASGSP